MPPGVRAPATQAGEGPENESLELSSHHASLQVSQLQSLLWGLRQEDHWGFLAGNSFQVP